MSREPFFRRVDPLLWTALGLLLLYLIWAAFLPHGYFETVDEGGKALYIQNTLRTGSPAAPFIYPGRSLDPQGVFFPTWWRLQRGTEFYTWWQPGFPLATLPFYALFGWFGLFILPALGGAATAYLSGRLLRQLVPAPRWLAVTCALIVGLATPVMFYSANFHEHTLATALALGSILSALASREKQSWRLAVVAGILASLAVFFRTETVTLLFGVGLVLLIADWRLGLRFGLGFVFMALPWMGLNQLITGYPINHHVSSAFTPDTAAAAASSKLGIKFIPEVLFGQPGIAALAPSKTFLLLASAFTLVGLALVFVRRARVLAALAFLAAGITCTWMLFSPVGYRTVHGLVTVAPEILFAAALLTMPPLWKRSLFPWMLAAGSATFAVFYVWQAWSAAGGIQWGPRYMLTFYPLLVVSALAALVYWWPGLDRFARVVVGASFLICVLIGVGFEARGWYTNRTMLTLYRDSEPYFQQKADAPIVTSYCDPPLHIPDLYWQQIFFSTTAAPEGSWQQAVPQMGLAKYYRLDSWDVCQMQPFTPMIQERAANPSGLIFTEVTP